MQCKEPGYLIAHATTLSILNLLSRYSWDAKAVLTLAAFALDYGEFCLLVKIQSSEELAKSVGTLKRVPVLLKGVTMQKNQQAFINLNKVVKTTPKVIKCIFELESWRYCPILILTQLMYPNWQQCWAVSNWMFIGPLQPL